MIKRFFMIVFWRILKKSFIFKYWYKKHLTELLFDLEIFDLDKIEITEKYKNKLVRIRNL